MSLNLLRSSMNVPPTFGEILFAKMLDKAFSTLVTVSWEQDFLLNNHLEDFVWSLSHKWGSTDDKFIKHNAESVPISCITITLTQDYFRSHVLRCSAKGVCSFMLLNFFYESKVSKFDIAIQAAKNVFGLQISVNGVSIMQVL